MTAATQEFNVYGTQSAYCSALLDARDVSKIQIKVAKGIASADVVDEDTTEAKDV